MYTRWRLMLTRGELLAARRKSNDINGTLVVGQVQEAVEGAACMYALVVELQPTTRSTEVVLTR